MDESLSIDFLNLLIGIILTIGAILYFIKILKEIEYDNKYDAISYTYDINIIFGCLVFLIVGIVLIYRELNGI